MSLAADAVPPGSPWWLFAAGLLVTVLVAFIAARGPVWVEKAKRQIGKAPDPPQAVEKASAGEEILREWRDATQAELDQAEARVDKLEAELYRRGWDGRLP